MSSQPSFAAAPPLVGTGVANASADTSYTAPTNVTTLSFSTAIGNNGAKITQVDYLALGTTLAGLINLFLFDGTTYHLVDTVPILNIVASTTAAGFSFKKPYANLYIPASTWSMRFTSTVASQLIEVVAYGANF